MQRRKKKQKKEDDEEEKEEVYKPQRGGERPGVSAKLRFSRSHLSSRARSPTFYVQLPRASSVSPAPPTERGRKGVLLACHPAPRPLPSLTRSLLCMGRREMEDGDEDN